MNKKLMVLALVAAVGCSSSSASAPAPVISDFKLDSPLAAGSTTVSGSLQASDMSGLTDLSLSITIKGPGVDSTLSAPVEGSTTETAGTIPVVIELSTAIPAGTYDVAVTLMESGEASNSLSATVVVQ
jgi:hypothetical protein